MHIIVGYGTPVHACWRFLLALPNLLADQHKSRTLRSFCASHSVARCGKGALCTQMNALVKAFAYAQRMHALWATAPLRAVHLASHPGLQLVKRARFNIMNLTNMFTQLPLCSLSASVVRPALPVEQLILCWAVGVGRVRSFLQGFWPGSCALQFMHVPRHILSFGRCIPKARCSHALPESAARTQDRVALQANNLSLCCNRSPSVCL